MGVAPLKTDSGTFTDNSKEQAELLNKQFQSVFTKEDTHTFPQMDGPQYQKIYELKISTEGVEKLLKNLKVNKASGPDDIPGVVLKELAHELAPVLAHIFTQSLETGELPEDWLKANIAPIYKKGNRNLAENYRPVSLTCICCKVMEHIICKHMLDHLDLYKILTHLQHGFRNGYSCETQLLVTLHDLMTRHNQNEQIDMIILDFSKAFDTVPHDKLLYKLKHYGIKGNILGWISVFLKRRVQRVVVNGKSSEWIHVDSGVPQGTVLGPLLFLLYINDLPKCVSEGTKARLFADDCIIYRTIKCIQDQIELQNDLNKLSEWADKWGMKFNASKCQVMRINRSRNPYERFYVLNGTILQQVDKAKYLGVMITEDLNWTAHVDYITAKAHKVLGLLRRNLKHCPQELREIAYISMVRSILEYASAVWDPHLEKDKASLERVQRRAARFVKNDYKIYNEQNDEYTSVTKMMQELGWKNLEERRRDIRLAILYKITHNQTNIPTVDIIEPLPNHNGTRLQTTQNKFKLITSTINSHKFSFFPRTIRDWNDLPSPMVDCNTIESFKRKLKAGGASAP